MDSDKNFWSLLIRSGFFTLPLLLVLSCSQKAVTTDTDAPAIDNQSSSSSSGDETSQNFKPQFYSVALDSEVPTCTTSIEGWAYSVDATKKLKTCRSNVWVDIDLTGPKGDTGATGATGETGATGTNGTNGTNGIVTSSSARLGVGTESPANILHVQGSIDSYAAYIYQSGSTTSDYGGLKVRTESTAVNSFLVNNGGTDLFAIKGSGKVGIGTTSPSNPLHVYTSSDNYAGFIEQIGSANSSAGGLKISTNTTATISLLVKNGSTDLMAVRGSGKVGIGTASPSNLFHVYASSDDYAGYIEQVGSATSAAGGLKISTNTTAATALLVKNAASTLMIAKSDGTVGIGTDSPSYTLTVNGQPAANGYTTFTNYSDMRLKENVMDLPDGTFNKILQLKPRLFNYNDEYYRVTGYDPSTPKKNILGFIAQELKEVFPEMVGSKELNGQEYFDTNLSFLNIYLVKAIKEFKAWIDHENVELRADIERLKNENRMLKIENQEIFKRLSKIENALK